MGRRKKIEDGELLLQLKVFWEEECGCDRRRLTYPGFERYLAGKGIDGCTSNALKHRKAVIEAVNRAKSGGGIMEGSATESTPQATQAAPAQRDMPARYLELADKYKELVETLRQDYVSSACGRLLKQFEGVLVEEGPLKPEAAEKAVIGVKEEPFKHEFTKNMAAWIGLIDEEGE